jgi:DNA-binding CsgD family transcriptional regulator
MAEIRAEYQKLLKHFDETRGDVLQICKPLFNTFHINYFDYEKIEDLKAPYVHFHTAENIVREWVKKYPIVALSTKDAVSGVYSWEKIFPVGGLKLYRENGIKHGVAIIKVFKDYVEAYNIGTSGDQSELFEFCYNHRDAMEHFIGYFKDKATDLIKAVKKKNILLGRRTPISPKCGQELYKKFYDEVKIDKIHLTNGAEEATITFREYQCLMHLSKGKTLKEIGRILDISYKTVENHLANIKVKTGCFLTSQLIDLFWENFEGRI